MRVKKPETIAHPALKTLILRAIEKARYPGTAPQLLYEELADRIGEESLAVYIGLVGRRPSAASIVMLPTSRAMMYPQAILVYNEGPAHLRREMGERVRAFVTRHGFDRVLGVNLNHKDAVMMRGFADMGDGKVLGSLMEFVFRCS